MNCLLHRTDCYLECPKWQQCDCTEMKDTVRNPLPVTGIMILMWVIAIACFIAWATK